MSELQDFIAGMDGVHLHRQRRLTAFSHVHEGPLMDMLYSITRPPLRMTNAKAATHASHAAREQTPVPQPAIIRRGMVNYRREMSGSFEDQSK